MNFAFSMQMYKVKRFFSFVMATLMSLMVAAGAKDLLNTGSVSSQKSHISLCMYDSTYKVQRSELIGKKDSYNMYVAKNEYEACQIVFKARWTPQDDLKWIMEPLTNENGDTLELSVFKEEYIRTTGSQYYGYYPDALVPVDVLKKFGVGSNNVNEPYFLQVHTTPDTPAGVYSTKISIYNEGDSVMECEADLSVTVWDFTLPETPTSDTAFGLNRSHMAQKFGVAANSTAGQDLYEKYYEYLVSHRISPYSLPYDILDPRADAYMSDPRITSFMIPCPADDVKLKQYYDKVQSNPVWAAKGYFYPIDEPHTDEMYVQYNAITERLARVCPGYNMVTPFGEYEMKVDNVKKNAVNLQTGKSNILCPISPVLENSDYYEDLMERQNEGDKVWWYVCCQPKKDYCNVFTHWEGIKHRILFWQQKQFNVTGMLYWDTTYWKDVSNVWTDSLTTPWTGNDTFGDGSLFYNGNAIGINGPVSSLRLEAVCEGLEDYEYLTMAEELLGKEYVDTAIAKITKDLTAYTLDDSLFAKVRIQIGNDLNNAMK